MKPSEHPEFFTRAAPDGTSRESSIELDADGRFWHDGERVTHPALQRAFASWIQRHPENGRFILSNGYDWTYVKVAGTPFFVEGILVREDRPHLQLSDGSVEAFDPGGASTDDSGALHARVKHGQFEAKFSPMAQLQLEPWLEEVGDYAALRIGDQVVMVMPRLGNPNSCSG